MKLTSFISVGICCKFLGTEAIDYPYEFTFGGNPLAAHVSTADPSAKVWDDTVYVYTSNDGNLTEYGLENGDEWTYAHMDGYHVLSTQDMITWTDHGEIFNSSDVSWSPDGHQWAPCAARKDGKYYLYYPHKDFDENWKVGVAIADSPLGPFTDIGAPIPGATAIDPMVFVDDDGEAYMYLNSAMVAKMKPNMIELAEEFRHIDYGPQTVKDDLLLHFEEGSYMHKYRGRYYFSYSNSRQAKPTAYYGIGNSPYGPFEWKGALAGQKFSAPDHHSIIEFKGDWYYFYHMDTPWEIKNELNWYGFRRIACFEKMTYDRDNNIELVNPQYFHVNAGGGAYDSADGLAYNWDHWYRDGNSVRFENNVLQRSRDGALSLTERSGASFGYDVPMKNGVYNITFEFSENYFSSAGERSFHVWVEGALVIDELDIVAEAGGQYIAYSVNVFATVQDNELNVLFQGVQNDATVSAISAIYMENTGFAAIRQQLDSPPTVAPAAVLPVSASPVSAIIDTAKTQAPSSDVVSRDTTTEAPSAAPLSSGVTGFRLLNMATNTVVKTLHDNSVVNIQSLGLSLENINVEVIADSTVRSVRFLESSQSDFLRPFFFCASATINYSTCSSLGGRGRHTISVVPYSGIFLTGNALPTVSVTFMIV